MATGETPQAIQIPEFLKRRILRPRDAPIIQHQNFSTQVSEDNNLPIVEQTTKNQNSQSNDCISCLAEVIAGIATHQRWQSAKMPNPESTNT